MSNYQVSIAGSVKLDKFALMIDAEESTGAQFVKSEIAQNGTENVVTFADLAPGQRPQQVLQFLPGTAPASDKAKPAWTGDLMCEGTRIKVSAFRA